MFEATMFLCKRNTLHDGNQFLHGQMCFNIFAKHLLSYYFVTREHQIIP